MSKRVTAETLYGIAKLRVMNVGLTNWIDAAKNLWDDSAGKLLTESVPGFYTYSGIEDNGSGVEVVQKRGTNYVVTINPGYSEVNDLIVRAMKSNGVQNRKLRDAENRFTIVFEATVAQRGALDHSDMLTVYRNAFGAIEYLAKGGYTMEPRENELPLAFAEMDTALDLIRHRYGDNLNQVNSKVIATYIRIFLEDTSPEKRLRREFLDYTNNTRLAFLDKDIINTLNGSSGVRRKIVADVEGEYRGKVEKWSWTPITTSDTK